MGAALGAIRRRVRWRSRVGAVALAGAILLGAPSASGRGVSPLEATAEQSAQAQRHYLAGVEEYKAGRYREAAAAFDAAYEVVASPNARVMLARAYRESGDLRRAAEELARTQREAAELAATAPRYGKAAEDAEKELSELLQKGLAMVSVELLGEAQGAVVVVGQRAVPPESFGGVVVPPGPIVVKVRLPDGRALETSAEAVTGKVARLRLPLEEARVPSQGEPAPLVSSLPPERPGPTPVSPSDAPPPARSSLRPLAYVAGGVGLAGLVTFAVAGTLSRGTYSDLEAACPGGRCPPDRESDIQAGRTQQTIANVGLVIGLVGVGAGVTLFVLDPGSGEETRRARAAPRWTVDATAGGLRLGGTF